MYQVNYFFTTFFDHLTADIVNAGCFVVFDLSYCCNHFFSEYLGSSFGFSITGSSTMEWSVLTWWLCNSSQYSFHLPDTSSLLVRSWPFLSSITLVRDFWDFVRWLTMFYAFLLLFFSSVKNYKMLLETWMEQLSSWNIKSLVMYGILGPLPNIRGKRWPFLKIFNGNAR